MHVAGRGVRMCTYVSSCLSVCMHLFLCLYVCLCFRVCVCVWQVGMLSVYVSVCTCLCARVCACMCGCCCQSVTQTGSRASSTALVRVSTLLFSPWSRYSRTQEKGRPVLWLHSWLRLQPENDFGYKYPKGVGGVLVGLVSRQQIHWSSSLWCQWGKPTGGMWKST